MVYAAHDPLCIAESQLNTAFALFFEQEGRSGQEGYYSVITLAGAAEELLGKLLGDRKLENSLGLVKRLVASQFKEDTGISLLESEVQRALNAPKNMLKHGSSGAPIEFDAKQSARSMLIRASMNYYKLTSEMTDTMKLFWRGSTDLL